MKWTIKFPIDRIKRLQYLIRWVGRKTLIIWDEVPTMVEIVIFWFQIHITNGLNSLHQKWYTGNQYMDKSAENRMHSNLELLPVMNVKKWLKIAVCSSRLNIYLGTDNIVKQSFISFSSCPKIYFLWNGDVEYLIIQHRTGCTVYRRGMAGPRFGEKPLKTTESLVPPICPLFWGSLDPPLVYFEKNL